MRISRLIFAAFLALALTTYAFDCLAMSSAQDAMQCCESMPCSSHGPAHSDDCCKTMTATHASFVQPHRADPISFVLDFVATVSADHAFHGRSASSLLPAADIHAPPFPDEAASPLRL